MKGNTMSTTQPAYRAFTVVKREGQDDFWLAIGAAFPHQSGDGYNIILQALPIPNGDGQCKVVLRPPKADEEPDRRPQQGEDRNNKSGSRRR
jgi:hypothetical protein